MSPNLTAAVKAEARRLGFDLVGVAAAGPSQSIGHYRKWIEAGYQGEMGYLATERALERRADVRRILPECKSVLVAGMRHDKGRPADAEVPGGMGRVAAYAWGVDYHDVIVPKLEELAAFIERQAGQVVLSKAYTDTGPLLERELGARAGLGWIGKNSMLIHPEVGSYFLLGELLLSVELAADEPLRADHCGTCTRCLDACPTACILPERTIDARRCISYLTIELKGPVPGELRPMLGEWQFGCDVCQAVCPWNVRFAPQRGAEALRAQGEHALVDLAAELGRDAASFAEAYRGKPHKRAKRGGWLRNAALALGNAGDEGAVPALAGALRDEEALVREAAAWGLGRIGGTAAVEALRAALETEADEAVREEIKAALQGE